MSLKATTIVTEVNGTCGENLQDVYDVDKIMVPEGYVPVGFRSPRGGEQYLSNGGNVASATTDHYFAPKIILQALPTGH